MCGHLVRYGIRVQRSRLRASIHRVAPINKKEQLIWRLIVFRTQWMIVPTLPELFQCFINEWQIHPVQTKYVEII